MTDLYNIVAEKRESFGKGTARKLRAAGKIPAVIYGHDLEPKHVAVSAHDMLIISRRKNALISVEEGKESTLTVLKSIQKDPVRQEIEHVDLVRVKAGDQIVVNVPVKVVGDSFSGTGKMIENTTIKVKTDAVKIPRNIEVDVTGMTAGQTIHAKDVKLPEGVVLADRDYSLLVNIIALRGGK